MTTLTLTPAAPHRIAIVGASGRMGRILVEAILASDDCVLSGASDVCGSLAIGQDAGLGLGAATGVTITADLAASLTGAQFLIDFTRPEGTLLHAALCAERGIKLVIGTTGFDSDGKQQITHMAQQVAMVMAPNMSVGVNVTLKLLEQAALALQSGYDVEITEAHHRHKVDAPSGTALKMGEVIAQAWGTTLAERAVYARHGITGERQAGSIGFASVRGGDIVGDHTVLFAGTGERIEITHKSGSRMTYALGSLRAVRFLAARERGLYDMYDVLGLN